MSRIFCFRVVGLFLFVAFLNGEEIPDVLELASDRWPPFTDRGENPRVALEIVEAALDRAEIPFELKVVPTGELTKALEAGSFEGSAALWKTPEREEQFHFSDPYLENRLVLVGLRGMSVSAIDLSALVGKRVGLVENYAYGPQVESAEGPIFVEGKSDQENLSRLMAGELDYLLVDELLIRHLMERSPRAREELAVGRRALVRRGLHLGILKGEPDAELRIERFNQEIRAMQGDGTYNAILNLNWIRVDTDGDGRLELVMGEARGNPARSEEAYPILEPFEARAEDPQAVDIWIDGRRYDSWETVPGRYKGPAEYDMRREGAILYQFKF